MPSSASESHGPPSLVLTVFADLAVGGESQIARGAGSYINVQAGRYRATNLYRDGDRLRRIDRVGIAHRDDAGRNSRGQRRRCSKRIAAACRHRAATSSCAGRPPNRRSRKPTTRASGSSEPSASLYASTVCVCSALPLTPCAMETGPTVDDTRRNRGAALRPAAQKKAAAKNRGAVMIRPTREPPSYTPRCSRPPESPGIPPLRPRRTSATDGI